MKFNLVVHSVSNEPVLQDVTLANGQKVEASVPGMVVELVDPIDERNNQTFRFIPPDWAKANELFVVGDEIVLSLAKAKKND